jgi:hypothetical protein
MNFYFFSLKIVNSRHESFFFLSNIMVVNGLFYIKKKKINDRQTD